MRTQTALGFVLASAIGALAAQACGPTTSTCEELRTCGGGDAGESTAGNAGTGGAAAGSNTGGSSSGSSGKAGAGGKAGAAGASGADSGAGNAGSAGAPPCDGTCGGTTSVCVAATNTCVECTDNSTCKIPKAACDTATNKCVECTDKSTCKAPKPACDTTNACAECVAKTDCTDSAKPLCDTIAEKCVACLQQSDCTSATASACNAGQCQACTKDAECSGIAGKGVCNAGTCVQCTATKQSACGGNSCNPATKQCTTTPVGTIDLCGPCLADNECIGGNQADPDARCVPMKFMGVARVGGFCLKRVAKTCAPPFEVIVSATSLSGSVLEDYCGINQDATRCEALLDLANAQTCPDGNDTSCGCARDKSGKCTEVGVGGLCRTVGPNANRCTVPCGSPDDCTPGKTCSLAMAYCH